MTLRMGHTKEELDKLTSGFSAAEHRKRIAQIQQNLGIRPTKESMLNATRLARGVLVTTAPPVIDEESLFSTEAIKDAVCKVFEVSFEELLSAGKRDAMPRHVLSYIAHRYGKKTVSEIAEYLGQAYGTAHLGWKKVADSLPYDRRIAHIVSLILAELGISQEG